jgi:NTP pyrophosphatase (non-canonical NTP hydrolase)
MEISELEKRAGEYAIKNGWYKPGEKQNIGELLMLIVTEISEACEASRYGKITSTDSEVEPTLVNADTISKDDYEKYVRGSVAEELSDAVIRIADLAFRYGIDLDWNIRAKQHYNTFREYRHGGKLF